MNKDSFILYNSFYEPIKALKNEQLGKLLRAIFDYTTSGKITQDADILVAFMFIKNQLDIDNKKWEETKDKRSEAGRLGGIQRALNKNQELSSKSKQCLNELSKSNQNQANQPVNVNENDNVNVNVNDNVNNNIYSTTITTTNNINNNTIYDYVEQNFGRTLAPAEYEEISKWEDNELTRYAIKQAVLSGAYNYKYINRILESYKNNSIKSVQQAQEFEKKFRESKEENSKYAGMSYKERKKLEEEKMWEEYLKGDEQ